MVRSMADPNEIVILSDSNTRCNYLAGVDTNYLP